MAPKRKGHVAYGKARVFHHAVETVHVGLGHAVLGSLSLQLAAGPPQRPRRTSTNTTTHLDESVALSNKSVLTDEQAAMPAFGLELDALMQSHSAKDFKRFRWEVKEWCATRALFQLHHRLIAEKLLRALLERNAGRYSSKSKHRVKAIASEADESDDEDEEDEDEEEGTRRKKDDRTVDSTRGLTSEGFEAFARLTIAFARDLQADFLPYYEVFQRALQAGLYDRQGQLLADATRVQLIYAVQAAWCREMMWYWPQKEHRVLVQRIVRLYVVQLSDRKDYLRRLTAELLGYLCRLAHSLLPLVVSTAAEQLLEAYEHFCTATTVTTTTTAAEEEDNAGNEDEEGEEEVDDEQSCHAAKEHTVTTDSTVTTDPALWATFIQRELRTSTLLDGLASLCAEMLRGMRGALNSAVDLHYRLLLRSFLLCESDYCQDDEAAENGEDEEEAESAQQQRVNDLPTVETMPEGAKEQPLQNNNDVPSNMTTFSVRWGNVFAVIPVQVTEGRTMQHSQPHCDVMTCVAQEIVRAAGRMALEMALIQVLHETRKATSASLVAAAEEANNNEMDNNKDVDALDIRRPAHRLLSIVVHGLLALPDSTISSLSRYDHHHLRLLTAVLMAEDGLLLRDAAIVPTMRDVSRQLRRSLSQMSRHTHNINVNESSNRKCEGTSHNMFAQALDVQYVAALLELIMPFCLSPMLETNTAVTATHLTHNDASVKQGNAKPHALLLQEVLLPVGKQCVALALQWSAVQSRSNVNALAGMTRCCLWAFVQDVLQKSYAYALQEDDGRGVTNSINGVASEEDDEEEELDSSKATHANGHYTVTDQAVGVKRASRMGTRSTATAAAQTRSALTPLGLTLLHRVFVVYCGRATEQLLLTKHVTKDNAAKAYNEAVTSSLPQDLTQTILMLRAAAESTLRQSCSPLQQLMRLRLARPSKATQSQSSSHESAAQTSAGAELQGSLEHLLLSLITTLTAARTEAHDTTRYASHALAELLACAWPVVQALLQVVHTGTHQSEVASQRLDKMQDALLALMHTVDADVHGNPKSAQTANTPVMVEESGTLAAEALSYTLYVQIAALLMRLSDRTKVLQSAHSSSTVAHSSTRVQGMRYLVESIAMLGRGFDSLRRASTTTTTTMESDEAAGNVVMNEKSTVGVDVENALRMDSHDASQHLQLSITVGSVEAARRRLFAGAEVLLDSLAWALHYNGQLNITNPPVSDKIVEEEEQVEGEATKPVLQRNGPSRRTREALGLLKQTLCTAHSEKVAWQMREILFECLTAAQPARVRLRALELLALLTHPSLQYTTNNFTHNGTVNAEEGDKSGSDNSNSTNGTLYLPGLCEVDPHVMQALLRAERYNPLAERSGHVDGLRQTLTPLLFRCESGQMSATGEAMSLTRAIVGRAMIGLFYRKYAPAWPMAIKILAALAHTSHTKHAHNNNTNNNNNGNVQDVDVWQDIICRYAPLLVLGGQSQPARRQLRPTRRTFTNDNTNEGEVGQSLAVCFYDIRFTLQEQRAATQEQGSLAHNMALAQATSNNSSSSTASSSSSSLLLSILAAASEGVSGNTSLNNAVVPLLHWQSQSMNSNADIAITGNEKSTMLYRTGTQSSTSSSAAAVRKESERWHTDSATVACSFLAMLAEVMQSCSNSSSKETRRKIALVRQLVLALSALHRNTHGAKDTHTYSTTTTTNTNKSSLVQSVGTVRRLEDRLVAAMQALAQAPYIPVRHSSSSMHNNTRVSENTTCERNNEEGDVDEAKVLQGLFLSYLTEGQQGNVTSTAKLQRAALDNLKRLKVRPFATYYAQLVPFTDTVKALFGFLSTFHIDTDIPTHDRADYLAAALTIALPKLLAKGSKDKLKQQALLRRRLMSLVAQLPDDTSGRAIAEVLQKLVHRLVFTSAGSVSKDALTSEEKTIHKQSSEEVQDVSMYDFLSQWQRMIAQNCAKQTSTNDAAESSDTPTYYVPQPLLRRVERLAKHLTSAMELLEAVLHAIGTRFASYVPACLHLSCQAYLFACTHLLRESALSAVQQESNAANVTPSLVKLNIPTHTATALAALRRASLTVVQMLFAQLPSEVMNTTRQDITHVQQGNASEGKENVLSSSLLGRYLHALQLNTRGTQRNAQAAWQDGRAGAAQYAKATPTLRLVTSWVKAPVLHPLLPAYSDFTLETLTTLLTLSDGSSNSNSNALGAAALKAAAGVLYEAMRDITDILDAADEPMQPLITTTTLTTEKKQKKKSIRAKKGKKAVSTTTSDEGVNETIGSKAILHCTTLREAFVRPYITRLFAALYRLVVRGAGEGSEGKRASRSSVFSFSVAMWEEIMKTVSLLASQLSNDIMTSEDTSLVPATGVSTNSDGPNEVVTMLGRLLEIVLRFVTHPICAAQSTSVTMATAIVQRITAQLPIVDLQRHFRPLVHLFNVVTNPQARLTLCETVSDMMNKLPIALRTENKNKEGEWVRVEDNEGTSEDVTTTATKTKKQQRKGEAKTRSTTNTAQDDGASNAWSAQLQAVGRAVHCLNSFAEDNTSLEQYDYELRYHTFHSLLEFFIHDGNYDTTTNKKNEASSRTRDAVRQEREYSGAQDVRIPLHSNTSSGHVPVLALEAFALLMANVLFFLRDTQSTIRALAAQLLEAMIGYAARQPYAHSALIVPHQNNTRNEDTNEKSVTYKTAVLHDVIRAEVLPSLRRGVVARDTLIRYTHMSAFNALAKYYSTDFASFALLFARNSEQNFFSLVGHVQPRCRLHALALLRQAVPTMQIRDLLRVFVPFLMTAVKDYAQGKWTLPNTSEGRARGYCDAVLQTIATIASALPWQAYYHVLSLLLLNAREQAALRVVMLRGVVQVLHAFHFLNNSEKDDMNNNEEGKESEASADDNINSEEDEEEEKAWRAKRAQYRQHHILYVLEQDILPQLFDYVSESKQARKALGMTTTNTADLRNSGNQHTAEKIRSEQAKADAAQSRHTLLQLPVAVAITKIIARFPEEALDRYLDHLIDAVVLKLRNKQHDKQRDRARRMLAAILHEVGPRKLERVLVKLRDNLVHGYQLHVLGYTVVTLLYQLYEPHSALARQGAGAGRAITSVTRKATSTSASVSKRRSASAQAETKDDDDEGTEQKRQRRRLESSTHNTTTSNKKRHAGEDDDDEDEREEAELMRQLRPTTTTSTSSAGQPVSFDYEEGVACLTRLLPSLMQLLLDSYLGEVGLQKEQVELMSTMVEVKTNRALQGFTLLARHCAADKVLETFLHQITWLLTPPTLPANSTESDVSTLHGSARARALIVQALQQKYTTLSKGAQADLPFVDKVRGLAVRVARSLTVNPTLHLEHALSQIRDLLARHNAVREAKIAAFEAKDGTRRIRGNAHIVLHRVERLTRKEQLDKQLLIAREPERVDVDFSAHTVLATQNKQKLRVYRGRYGTRVQDAAKDFYREDPSTAIVLDTLDEFLLRCLLSTLKKVLGIGRQKGSSAAAVQLDLLRQRRLRRTQAADNKEEEDTKAQDTDTKEDGEEEDEKEHSSDSDDEDALEPRTLQEESDEDALDRFVSAQEGGQQQEEEEEHTSEGNTVTMTTRRRRGKTATTTQRSLAVQFTQTHRPLLESLVPVILLTLRGEGADAVVAEALDCLLALVALQPPLAAVEEVSAGLFESVTSYFGRGGAIKQRAMRVCAGLIAHQKFTLSPEQASQLVLLARAEIIERSEFLPMALRLLYAILGKHIHVVEVYAIVDIITELLVHLAGKAVVRQRCLHILVRFLTEYKLTREKFRSHIELLLRNLDFPELAGRLALLELLDQLVRRLPTVILRDEAPLLLVPLAAARTGAEWAEVREKAATVLSSLVRGAGLDVLTPLLAAWLQERQPRAQRNVGLQVWATLLPAVIGMYDLTATTTTTTSEVDEERAALLASVSWSVPSVLAGCLYVPPAPKKKKSYTSPDNNSGGAAQHSARAQARRGWTVVFYSLRCAESMLTALPEELYPMMGPQLLPFCLQNGILHPHPWVQAVSLRLVRHYCYNYVESRAHFLRHNYTNLYTSSNSNNGRSNVVEGDSSDVLPFLNLTHWQEMNSITGTTSVSKKAVRVFCEAGKQTFLALIGALKTVLQRVSMTDVSSEKYMALRALRDPSRTQSLKLMFYLSKAITHIALSLLHAVNTTTTTTTVTKQDEVKSSGMKEAMHTWLRKEYALLHHQLHALIAPTLKQQSVVNYLVRSTTLVQFFGAYISVLPTVHDEANSTQLNNNNDDGGIMLEEKRWLLQADGMNVPALLRETIWPLLKLALHAGVLSRKLAMLSYQSATVLQGQLTERQVLLTTADTTTTTTTRQVTSGKRKRAREADYTDGEDGTAEELKPPHASGVEDIVREMTAVLAELQGERRTKQIRRETHKAMKRSRQEMSSARVSK